MNLKQKQAMLEAIADRIINREVEIELAQSCLNPVPGEGNADAELMFIGEAPGAKEDKLGQPFMGASGKFLGEMLNSIELKREDVFITNIVKFRPPKNRDPNQAEIKASMPILFEQIAVIRPKLVIFLGRHSMNVFFPKLKISEAHGERIEGEVVLADGNKIIQNFLPLYHPAAALYNGSMRNTLLGDFAKIPHVLELIKQ
ncbi:MAG: uracil-DNA glycosylase [Candidatus Saccharibacteria bacterium]|jgi:DNA polymerase